MLEMGNAGGIFNCVGSDRLPTGPFTDCTHNSDDGTSIRLEVLDTMSKVNAVSRRDGLCLDIVYFVPLL